ncbi:Tcm62p KNAG_0J00960 [Huiozyma naganishii CBS 8797]|uniref:Mitochondrial chaperone TCM62 n=1 Tax=Huiozyma naganishii (strain ATCC MYA-139 / BCRC 22969 / CBS 8797 / KCTC 17520 / NBRC 10181 / NCYC 3082 / Yp74L-3) TaxID=1071383 RepID=J7RQT4_HUIN7|nr:hypothetical protein KNAG_0J00960 [Kazachstania naganishii CBS 8797]CCK72178.1 hypothetical protein KNAG_0J00960 [Kazachstania naganishii CBS 8797]
MFISSRTVRTLRGIQCHTVRTVTTKYTVAQRLTADFCTKLQLTNEIKVLDKVLNAVSHNSSMLYKGKYRNTPQIIGAQDYGQLQHVANGLVESLERQDVLNSHWTGKTNIGKIALQLFLDCHKGNVTPLASSLTCSLLQQFLQYPYKSTVQGMINSLKKVQAFLHDNKLTINDSHDIDILISHLTHSPKDAKLVREVMQAVNYKLFSDDIVRVVRGKRTTDEIDISKGWKFTVGLLNESEPYLRSIDIPKNKLVSANEPLLVLVYDGTLREANKILPTLTYMNKVEKSLLLIVTDNCVGEALASITINNNRNKRKGSKVRTYVMRYNEKDNDGRSVQENTPLLDFLELPNHMRSVYSPEFSEMVPSTINAQQYFGSVESLKATTGEIFLYNSSHGNLSDDAHLRTTITVNVGGENEIEIDQRKHSLDNLVNNVLCHGLKDGFVPTYGIALVKCIPMLSASLEHIDGGRQIGDRLDARLGVDATLSSLPIVMESALTNMYGFDRFTATSLISQTVDNGKFTMAQLSLKGGAIDTLKTGALEPWNKMDATLNGIVNFFTLLSSCEVAVSRVFAKPSKTPRS